MGIHINFSNPYNPVLEAERNTRVIKEMFWIAYYQLRYKKIPRAMIFPLAMNVTQNFNLTFQRRSVVSLYLTNDYSTEELGL